MASEEPARSRRPAQKGIPSAEPWVPPAYEEADVHAIKALAGGTATPDQQKRALQYIVHEVCRTYDQSFRPGGPDGARATDFAEGKRFVGNQLVKFINLPLNAIRKAQGKAPLEQPD